MIGFHNSFHQSLFGQNSIEDRKSFHDGEPTKYHPSAEMTTFSVKLLQQSTVGCKIKTRRISPNRHISFLALVLLFVTTLLSPVTQTFAVCPVSLISIDTSCSNNKVNNDDLCDNIGDNNNKEGQLVLHDDGLRYIASLPSSPLYIVPILGVYRGGKSMLLNRIMNLTAPYSDGFSVGHSQRTHTQGINVCIESVKGLGTVLWMDTEGIWSSEDELSAHGPKLFSLALLLSSTVLLNQVRVLEKGFFGFFAEQQQMARVLKDGLREHDLPEKEFLPIDLEVMWVLQQPVQYTRNGDENNNPLDGFLTESSDTLRRRVAKDFHHSFHVIPVASMDVDLWKRLDEVSDSELLSDYINSTQGLRNNILSNLKEEALPMRPATVVSNLKFFVDLVNTKSFTASLAVEAFEEGKISQLCESFSRTVTENVGVFPTINLQTLQMTFERTRRDLEPQAQSLIDTFHLDDGWNHRFQRCLEEKETEMSSTNWNAVLNQWYKIVDAASEGGDCFFLDTLDKLFDQQYKGMHGEEFNEHYRDRALGYAKRLQRTRFLGCIRLGHVLSPLLPWFLWPFASFYLQERLRQGVSNMLTHAFLLVAFYSFLQQMNLFPSYLRLDYPFLEKWPYLLNWVMWLPPWPWKTIGQFISWIGLTYSSWCIIQQIRYLSRAPGNIVNQLLNLELKLNQVTENQKMLLQNQRREVRRYVRHLVIDIVNCIDKEDARMVCRYLTVLLAYIRDHDDLLLQNLDLGLQVRIQTLLAQKKCSLPPQKGCINISSRQMAKRGDKLIQIISQATDIGELLQEICCIYELIMLPSKRQQSVRNATTKLQDFTKSDVSVQLLATELRSSRR